MSPVPLEEAPGISVFYKNEAGEVFQTYAALSYAMEWVRHHDRYASAATAPASCCAPRG